MNIPMNLNTSAIALGSFFLIFAIIQYCRLWRLNEKGIKITAIIKDFEDALHNMRFPILEYKTLSGEVFETVIPSKGDRPTSRFENKKK